MTAAVGKAYYAVVLLATLRVWYVRLLLCPYGLPMRKQRRLELPKLVAQK